MTTLPLLISSCRIHAGDGPSDNFARGENLNTTGSGNVIDGSNLYFYTDNFPVSALSVVQVDNRNVTSQALLANPLTGQIALTTAPTTSIYVSYNYYLFTDEIWTEFITSALELLNVSTGNPSTDIVGVLEGLLPSVKFFANAFFCYRVARQTGLWYNRRLQERVEDRDSISAKWSRLGDTSMKQGLEARDQFYSGSGTSHGPAVAILQMQPLPYTPRN